MKYTVDGWNNFCRVFELPKEFPKEFCFGGGHSVTFQMVDWFNPVIGIDQPAISKDAWIKRFGKIDTKEVTVEELRDTLMPFLVNKQYIKSDRDYLILFDFGATFLFDTKSKGE